MPNFMASMLGDPSRHPNKQWADLQGDAEMEKMMLMALKTMPNFARYYAPANRAGIESSADLNRSLSDVNRSQVGVNTATAGLLGDQGYAARTGANTAATVGGATAGLLGNLGGGLAKMLGGAGDFFGNSNINLGGRNEGGPMPKKPWEILDPQIQAQIAKLRGGIA